MSSDPTDRTDQPPRTRKTHTSEDMIQVLKSLPRGVRISRNNAIEERNGQKAIDRSRQRAQPELYPDEISDDESLITVSEESPQAAAVGIMGKLSPDSVRKLIRALPALGAIAGPSHKRPREDDVPPPSNARLAAKRLREEIHIRPGMSLPIVFHAMLQDLFFYNIYMPLSLFTTSNLCKVNATAAVLDTRKLNPAAPGDKQIRVLDVSAFEAAHGREEDLSCVQWKEGAQNYLSSPPTFSCGNSTPPSLSNTPSRRTAVY
ncbi:hypothetical protein C8R45DRAFT_941616 [Mycena sanguinolenta]|nr:hypothetical protein C8R45DRAFT_941616 [Mycena sanguinolenta]